MSSIKLTAVICLQQLGMCFAQVVCTSSNCYFVEMTSKWKASDV